MARLCHCKSKRTGERCKAHAYRQNLKGEWICWQHGGANRGRPPVTGRYSKFFAPDDDEGKAAYEAFRDDPNIEELANEVAIVRAKFGRFQKESSKRTDSRTIDTFLSFVDGIGKAVERRHKIQYGEQYTITTRDWQALSARLFDLVREVYGEDERYARLLERVREVIGARVTGAN